MSNKTPELPAPSKRCCNSPLMQLLFHWMYLEASPVALCYWWYFFSTDRRHVVYSTMNSLCYTCCTHSQEGNGIYTLQKREMSTCFFPKFRPSSYQNFISCFFVRFLGIWLPQTFCKMLDAFTSPGKCTSKPIYVWPSVNFLPPIWAVVEKMWYLPTVSISLILRHEGQILPLMSTC